MLLAGCAASEAPQSHDFSGAPVSISAEPAVGVGQIIAAFVTVHLSSQDAYLPYPPKAVTTAGALVWPLQIEQAIEKAGGAKKVVSALNHTPSGAKWIAILGGGCVGQVVFLPLVGPFACAAMLHEVGSISALRLDEAWFRCDGGGYTDGDYWDCRGPATYQGYLFFPRDSYVRLRVDAVIPKSLQRPTATIALP